jgi:hypothetical protein
MMQKFAGPGNGGNLLLESDLLIRWKASEIRVSVKGAISEGKGEITLRVLGDIKARRQCKKPVIDWRGLARLRPIEV